MTVKELMEELNYYDAEEEVVFEFDDEVEVDSWTDDKYGLKSVTINKVLKPAFISEMKGKCRIELEVENERKTES